MTKPYSNGIINVSNERGIKNGCSFDFAVFRNFVPCYFGPCLASLLASSRPRYHRNRHFRHRVLVEAGTRNLDYSRAFAGLLLGRFKGVIKMMPYFWLTLGVLAKVTGRTDGGNYRYETVVSKEIGLVTAEWVNTHLL